MVAFLVIIARAFLTKKVSIERLYRTGVSYGNMERPSIFEHGFEKASDGTIL